MNEFVTILTANHPAELSVIASRLEDEGIEHHIENELLSQSNAFLSRASGGARLIVHQSDIARATEILKENGKITEHDLEQTPQLSNHSLILLLTGVGIAAVLLILMVYLFS
ncbi:MAG: DUF2007 domain-containing protein [Chitinophagales bacterium]